MLLQSIASWCIEMSGRTILNIESPKTQSIDAIKSLLAFVGRASDPLPSDVSLENGRLVLVLSNKKDAYYTATEKKCSCPAANYHQGPCKHQRKYFATPKKSPAELEAESDALLAAHNASAKKLARPEAFRPFDKLPSEERAEAA